MSERVHKAAEVVVLSGKGGTGKTCLLASLAVLATGKVVVDCDVDAPDLHLLLHPEVKESRKFALGQVASIYRDRCTECGLCKEVCRFDAIKGYTVDPIACEGCGFCSRVCPEEAIVMRDSLAGHWFVSETRHGPMVHARLKAAQENSGRLVSVVRQQARLIAERQGLGLVLCDGPPGTGCPAISSVSGADLAVLVTEPTLSGMHDLVRVMGVCRHFGVPVVVCVNKYDLNEANTHGIERLCREQGINVVSRIPYDDTVTEAVRAGVPVVEYSGNSVAAGIEEVWDSIRGLLGLDEGHDGPGP